MNELEKAYQEIEMWHCCAEQEGFVGEEEISYLDYVKNCINNLQSKIDKINLFKLYLQERLLKHKDEIERGINEFDERNECEDILNEFINFFKEDK